MSYNPDITLVVLTITNNTTTYIIGVLSKKKFQTPCLALLKPVKAITI